MRVNSLPNPGSEEAKQQGCSCPRDQSHGFGLDVWAIHTQCHMHKIVGVRRDGVIMGRFMPLEAS